MLVSRSSSSRTVGRGGGGARDGSGPLGGPCTRGSRAVWGPRGWGFARAPGDDASDRGRHRVGTVPDNDTGLFATLGGPTRRAGRFVRIPLLNPLRENFLTSYWVLTSSRNSRRHWALYPLRPGP